MRHVRSAWIFAGFASALLTGGCRENEQNRPLDFEPHIYQGQKQPALGEKQLRDLQERGTLQK